METEKTRNIEDWEETHKTQQQGIKWSSSNSEAGTILGVVLNAFTAIFIFSERNSQQKKNFRQGTTLSLEFYRNHPDPVPVRVAQKREVRKENS